MLFVADYPDSCLSFSMANRQKRLDKIFRDILEQKTAISPANGKLYLEAITSQPDRASCLNAIYASRTGLAALQQALRYDLTVEFLNGLATSTLLFFQAPELRSIGGGDYLNDIIIKLVDPPIFWNVFCESLKTKTLVEQAKLAFAGLLLQLVLISDIPDIYRDVAKDHNVMDVILSSSQPDTRKIGQRIKQLMSAFTPINAVIHRIADGPGGRHSNDFANFKEIEILPPADEIASKKRSFMRTSNEIDQEVPERRWPTYLDNQFRLLREDMIYEIREELQVSLGQKKGRTRGFIIDGATLVNTVHCGRADKAARWSVIFECHHDFREFKNMKKFAKKTIQTIPKPQETPDEADAKVEALAARKKFLTSDNAGRKVMRHQSLAFIVVDGEMVAFGTVNRDEDYLSKSPPHVILQLEGKEATRNALIKVVSAKHIKIIQVDTAVFAYEPVLTAIKAKKELRLATELLFWTEGQVLQSPEIQPNMLVQALRTNPLQDIRPYLQANTKTPICLDAAQSASLLSALTQRVSLIQGPPGKLHE